MWGPWWQGRQGVVLCDNMAVVNIIASNTSKDRTCMHLLRGLHFICAHYNTALRASHIEGAKNVAADAVSRNYLQVFHKANPTANTYPTPIPHQLWQVLVVTQPDWLSGNWRDALATSLGIASLRAHENLTPPDNHTTGLSAAGSTCSSSQPPSSSSFCSQQKSHSGYPSHLCAPTYQQ